METEERIGQDTKNHIWRAAVSKNSNSNCTSRGSPGWAPGPDEPATLRLDVADMTRNRTMGSSAPEAEARQGLKRDAHCHVASLMDGQCCAPASPGPRKTSRRIHGRNWSSLTWTGRGGSKGHPPLGTAVSSTSRVQHISGIGGLD